MDREQDEPWLYLNHKAIEAKGLDPADVAKTLAEPWRQDGVLRTFTRAQLEHSPTGTTRSVIG